MAISTELREQVRRLYYYRCGYCGVHERDVGNQLEIDHFKPRALGGTDELDNLVYCCPACNKFKHNFWPADEAPATVRRLLHPRRDNFHEHVSEAEDGRLIALSPTGAFHIQQLHLNRPQLLAWRHRRHLRAKVLAGIAEALAKRRRLMEEDDELAALLAEALTQIEDWPDE